MLERGEIEKDKLYPARWQSLIDYYGFDCKACHISDKYIERLATKSYMLEGALDLCKRLHGKFKMYIVTNGQKDIQRSRLFPSPIFRYFDGCFISEDIGYEKPSVRFFESVIKEIPGYNPEKALIIGDSLTSDMQGGINIGIDTCWYNPSGKALPDGYKLTYIVKDFDEMANVILN
jgi:2-haloacid dehalogenase